MNKIKHFTILDCNHTDSHNMFNSQLIEKLSDEGSILLFSWNRSYDNLKRDNIYIKKLFYIKSKPQNSFAARFILLINTFLNACYLKYFDFRRKSITIIIGYEIISFSICSFLFPRKSYLMHHMQIDEIKNKLKKYFFTRIKLNFNHVVMTDYIKDYLIENIGLNQNSIRVIPHPIYNLKQHSEPDINNYKTFVSLSYSNNESFVNRLIEEEKNNKIFERNNCRIIIKSKTFNFCSNGLIVFNKYLSEDEYFNLYNKSTCILSLLNDSFEYRISGTMIDAISAEKQIITLNTRCAEFYKNIFPNSINICKNIDDIILEIIKFNPQNNQIKPSINIISQYNKSYSDQVRKCFY